MIAGLQLECPEHRQPLEMGAGEGGYLCPAGCRFPVVDGIPRFVASDSYAASFGLQWNRYRRTQLDSFTNTTISRDRLARCLGGDLGIVTDRLVLEAGCGAGRFTEVLLAAGGRVLACDLSRAVEANRLNCGHMDHYFVCQADIARLPVAPATFDIVLCLGVVQHTADPEATIAALCRALAPGGLLVFDHYTHGYPVTPVRARLRRFMLGCTPRRALTLSRLVVRLLWPLHRAAWWLRHVPGGSRVRRELIVRSPVVDYHTAYPQLGARLLRQWAELDTHDTLTDHHKHLRSAAQLRAVLAECGMVDIVTEHGGNGVEARAWRPPRAAGRTG